MRGLRHFRCDGCYHPICRTAHRAFFLTEEERTCFVDLLWSAAFHVRGEYAPDEKVALMAVVAYIDRNPIKAKLVSRAEDYPWCGFSAACRGNARCFSPVKQSALTPTGRKLANA